MDAEKSQQTVPSSVWTFLSDVMIVLLGYVNVVLTLTQAAMIAPTDPLISMASSGSSVMMISSWFTAVFTVTAGKKSIALLFLFSPGLLTCRPI